MLFAVPVSDLLLDTVCSLQLDVTSIKSRQAAYLQSAEPLLKHAAVPLVESQASPEMAPISSSQAEHDTPASDGIIQSNPPGMCTCMNVTGQSSIWLDEDMLRWNWDRFNLFVGLWQKKLNVALFSLDVWLRLEFQDQINSNLYPYLSIHTYIESKRLYYLCNIGHPLFSDPWFQWGENPFKLWWWKRRKTLYFFLSSSLHKNPSWMQDYFQPECLQQLLLLQLNIQQQCGICAFCMSIWDLHEYTLSGAKRQLVAESLANVGGSKSCLMGTWHWQTRLLKRRLHVALRL